LRELFASCESDGKCRSAGNDVYCYASGARAEYTVPSGSCGDAGRFEVRVTKPDGSLCFTFEVLGVASQSACEQGDYFWRNPAGELIAIGNFSNGSGRRVNITCAANGDSMSCEPATCPTELPLFGNPECAPGDCP